MQQINVLDELVRTGCLISREFHFKDLISTLTEQSIDVTRSDLSALYIYESLGDDRGSAGDARLMYKRGRFEAPSHIRETDSLVEFLKESKEAVVLTEKKRSPFGSLLLDERMQSGVAFPLTTPKLDLGFLILNSLDSLYYNRSRFHFLDSLTKLTGGMLHNSHLFKELKESLDRIKELESYQQSIFSSMTNWLVTLDNDDSIRYVNEAARVNMKLNDEATGRDFFEYFGEKLDAKILKLIRSAAKKEKIVAGIEGIYTLDDSEHDFTLNVSPLLGRRNKHLGTTLLFTDQTREKELQEEMEGAVEDRRHIKDMFARYLSMDLVHNLMENPDQVRPGGSIRMATVFFADIRGYTSFSEGHSPEYIIEVLNDYFQEAVELVIKYRGYIDKFIGDCIMAAWGVPLEDPEKDAISAVTCAVEIQDLVASKERKFFTGQAKDLRIGIGMHTGPLVAGNLGSNRKMNFTVIGDTVNLASRLEGIAGPDEIIITQHTREYLGDRFRLKERNAVQVKGKKEPIHIFSVEGLR